MIKNIKQKKWYYLLAFLIPIILINIYFISHGSIFLQKAKNFAPDDIRYQYVHVLLYFRQILLGGNSIFYSIAKGLGGDMYSCIAYYLLSPLNLLTVFFKSSDIEYAFLIICVLKIGLAGLTMFILLDYKCKNNSKKALLLSVFYALSSYCITRYFCMMWFDDVYMAPLVILGLEIMLEKKNPKLYVIFLSLSIIFNYVIGFSICLFCVVYFIYYILKKDRSKTEYKNLILDFILYSLLAGMISCVIWLPAVYNSLLSDRSQTQLTTTFLDVLKRFFMATDALNDDRDFYGYQPDFHFGVFPLILVVSSFFNKNKNSRIKILNFIVCSFFIVSMFFQPLNYIWSGFTYNCGYNYRFSFLFSLFFILIAYEEFCSNRTYSKRIVFQIMILLLALILFIIFYNNKTNAWLTLVYVILYLILFKFCKKRRLKGVILVIMCFSEIIINAYFVNQWIGRYPVYYDDFIRDVYENIPNDKSDFYRVSGNYYYGYNELFGRGVSSTGVYFSCVNSNIRNFYSLLGLRMGDNEYEDDIYLSPVIESLLGAKYLYGDKLTSQYELLKKVVVTKYYEDNIFYEDEMYIYKNDNALSLGMMIDSSESINSKLAYEYQNQLVKNIAGIDKNVFRKIVPDSKNPGLSKSKYIYLDIADYPESIHFHGVDYYKRDEFKEIVINNDFVDDYVSLEDIDVNGYNAYYLDEDVFNEFISKLRESELKNIKINKNNIKGKIDVKNDGILMLTVPYEKGWTIYVDGKKVPYKKIYSTFIGVDLVKGKHSIKMVYQPPLFSEGLIISIISFLMFVLSVLFSNNSKRLSKI